MSEGNSKKQLDMSMFDTVMPDYLFESRENNLTKFAVRIKAKLYSG